ncbi:unnamed protein product, partial [Prorocentrum cordatum]
PEAADDAGGSPGDLRVGSISEGRMGCQAAVLQLPAPGANYPLCTRTGDLRLGRGRRERRGGVGAGRRAAVRQCPRLRRLHVAVRGDCPTDAGAPNGHGRLRRARQHKRLPLPGAQGGPGARPELQGRRL